MRINNTKNKELIVKLRKERNKLLKSIKAKQKTIIDEEIDNDISNIENAKNDIQFYKAIKYIRKPRDSTINIVLDKKGNIVSNEEDKYQIVKKKTSKITSMILKQKK